MCLGTKAELKGIVLGISLDTRLADVLIFPWELLENLCATP